jgi:hypothetical protein
LVAETSDRTIFGLDETFRTPAYPRADTGPVLAQGTESAELAGSVESPAPEPIFQCEFEVAADSEYNHASDGFLNALSFPCDPAPFYEGDRQIVVKTQATFLRPGSTYHYRIIAVNGDTTVRGLTQTFTTDPVGREPEPPAETPHHPGRRTPSAQVPCAKRTCSKRLQGSSRARVWVSPRFPRSYGWLIEVLVDGHPLRHTALEDECRSTFAGHGVIAKLNGCKGRIRLVYRGPGSIRLHWRVYAQCRCAEVGRAGVSVAPSTPR